MKNVLENTLGMRVLVIENEIGTEGIDHDLLIPHTAVKEDIVLMNNGCICCTGKCHNALICCSTTVVNDDDDDGCTTSLI